MTHHNTGWQCFSHVINKSMISINIILVRKINNHSLCQQINHQIFFIIDFIVIDTIDFACSTWYLPSAISISVSPSTRQSSLWKFFRTREREREEREKTDFLSFDPACPSHKSRNFINANIYVSIAKMIERNENDGNLWCASSSLEDEVERERDDFFVLSPINIYHKSTSTEWMRSFMRIINICFRSIREISLGLLAVLPLSFTLERPTESRGGKEKLNVSRRILISCDVSFVYHIQ